MSKLIRAIAISLALLLIPTPAIADSWTPPLAQAAQPGQSIVGLSELSEGNWDSRREAIKWGSDYAHSEAYTCHTLPFTGACDLKTSGFSFYGSNLLQVCTTDTQEDCIEGLTFSSSGGATVDAKHFDDAGGPIFGAIPDLNLQAAGQVSLWKADGYNHAGGANTYAVIVRSRQDWNSRTQKFFQLSLDATVVPYNLKNGNYQAPSELNGKNSIGTPQVFGNHAQDCVWSDAGECGVLQDFALGTQVSLKFRGSSELNGWFRGRIANTAITVSDFTSTNKKYEVSGQAVAVNRFAILADKKNTSQKIIDLFPAGSGGTGGELFAGNSSKFAFATDGWSGAPYTIIDEFRSAAKDTASGVNAIWSFESISEGSDNYCLSQKGAVLGIVTTNAMAYDGVAPTFEGGILKYRVAGMHYMPDGKTMTEGSYDLVIKSDVARCLYGFSSAPISATISVISDSGEAKTAITTVTESGGWLRLRAYGFSFSSPKINVKLSQAKVAKWTTISCLKGKTVKKVTGTSPKCPAGFKKK